MGAQPVGAAADRSLLVLSWNLFHGRAVPPVNRSLYDAFAAALGGWRWDVALLQEVPPWWPRRLAGELGVEQRSARTSRNSLLPLRRALAERRPELLKSNGGGCNAILARAEIVEHRTLPLRRWPERRVAQLARLGDGTCVVNVHASTRPSRAAQELERLWSIALAWAGGGRLVLGGDLNLRTPKAPAPPPAPPPALAPVPGPAPPSAPTPTHDASNRPTVAASPIVHVAGSGVDHVFARGLLPARAQADAVVPGSGAEDTPALRAPERALRLDGRLIELSDHAPLLVQLRAPPA